MADVGAKERGQDKSAIWMGVLGMVSGILSLFYAPFLFGGFALIMGVVTVYSKANAIGWWAILLGVVGPFINIIFRAVGAG